MTFIKLIEIMWLFINNDFRTFAALLEGTPVEILLYVRFKNVERSVGQSKYFCMKVVYPE